MYSAKLEKISKLPPAIQPIVLGAFLSRFFEEKGVPFTIVGGAAVQFYTQAEYLTGDLDVVLQGDTKEIVEEIMGSLGFKRTTLYRHFEHRSFNFTIEFPPSPIGVASRTISKVDNVETEEGSVRILRVEDLIMDRITAGVEWRDEPSLEQARLLWIKNKDRIDRKYLREFACQEGYAKILKRIMEPFGRRSQKGPPGRP